jgi:hypothetical protein
VKYVHVDTEFMYWFSIKDILSVREILTISKHTGQLHAPVAVAPEKEPLVSNG